MCEREVFCNFRGAWFYRNQVFNAVVDKRDIKFTCNCSVLVGWLYCSLLCNTLKYILCGLVNIAASISEYVAPSTVRFIIERVTS
jgi:hypothetical protein